jgi:hypothetical protein
VAKQQLCGAAGVATAGVVADTVVAASVAAAGVVADAVVAVSVAAERERAHARARD